MPVSATAETLTAVQLDDVLGDHANQSPSRAGLAQRHLVFTNLVNRATSVEAYTAALTAALEQRPQQPG
jgi:hypothetical protein